VPPVTPVTSLELLPYTATLEQRSDSWVGLSDEERKRKAARACMECDFETLWSLSEAYLYLFGAKGARVSKHTLRTYKRSVLELVLYSRDGHLSLLKASREQGARYVRSLETRFKPSSVGVRLAGARLLYKALEWAGLEGKSPLGSVKAAGDPVSKWDKRRPYTEEELKKLLALEDPEAVLFVLLGAHAGLRISEALALEWKDIDLEGGTLIVRAGKGGKRRSVPLSNSLTRSLRATRLINPPKPLELTLSTLRRRMLEACALAGVSYLGYHALRHSAGTRLYKESGDLETVARLLGHSSLETTRIYAKWSEDGVRSRLGSW